jgi:hypothetical protein
MYRPAGPREVWAEHLMANPGSFVATAGLTSDDWLYTAVVNGTPARSGAGGTTAHARDTTTYSTAPGEDSWYARFYGTLSPAKVSASATGSTRGGQLT